MEGYRIAVITVNPRGGDNRSAEISADILDGDVGGAEIWFCTDIKTVCMVLVDVIFYLSESRTDSLGHLFEKDFPEGVPKESIIEVLNRSPRSEVASATFRDKAMDMRVPFEIPAECMKDTNEAGDKVFRLIDVMKHTKNNISDGMEETVEERAVAKEIDPQFFGDGKNTVTVDTGNEFRGHAKRTYLIVLVAAGRAEAAVTTKWYELEVTAVRTAIHGTAKRGITAVDHLIDIFDHRRSGM